MIIKHIKLKNFKSHSDTQLSFDTGISVLIGENGAGKTSILEAVSFALFKQHVAKIDDLIKRETHGLEVGLVFEHNGREYKVIRKKRVNRGPESRLFIKNNGTFLGNMIQEGDRAVTEEIKKILQTDETLFLNAVYIRQGEIAGLLDANASERKNIVGRLLGIDSLQKAWVKMPEVIGDYESRRIKIETELERRGGLETDLQTNKKELEARERDKTREAEEISLQEKRVGELRNKKKEYDGRKERFLKLSGDKESREKGLKEKRVGEAKLSSKLKKIDEAGEEIEQLKPLIGRIPSLERLQQLESDEKIMLQEIEKLRENLKQITDYEEVCRETRANYGRYSRIKIEIEGVAGEREKYAGAVGELKQVEDSIHRSRGKMKKLGDEVSRALQEASSALDCRIDSIKQLKEILTQKKLNLEETLKETDSRYTELRDKISGLKARNRELEKAVTGLEQAKGKCPVCSATLTEEHKTKLLKRYNTSKASNNQGIHGLNLEVRDFELKKKELLGMRESINNIPVDLLESQSKTIQEERGEIRKRRTERDKYRERVEKLTEFDSILSEKEKLMKELEPDYRKYVPAQGFLEKYGRNKPGLEVSLASEGKRLMENKEAYQGYAGKLKTLPKDIGKELDMLRRSKARYDELVGVFREEKSLRNELAEAGSEIREYEREVKRLSGEVDALHYNRGEHESITKSLDMGQGKLSNLVIMKEKLEVGIERTTEEIKKLRQELEGLRRRAGELKELENFISFLHRLRDLFDKDGLQKGLRVRARPAIEHFTKEIFSGFDMGYSNVTLDDDYNIEMYGLGGSESIDMISGGEKIAVALALRLGIARVLARGRSELMILDEPTIHLDSYRRQELVQIFRKLTMLPQVILVTHDPELEGAADQLFRVERRDGNSTCTAA